MGALWRWSVVEESVDGLTPLALDPVRCPVDASFLTFQFSLSLLESSSFRSRSAFRFRQ
jgi:hypothetical protein